MTEVLAEYSSAEIYNFAAYSSGTGMFNDAVDIGEVNGLAVARILDAIRTVGTDIRFCHVSSSEILSNALESPQSEITSFRPRTPYDAAKTLCTLDDPDLPPALWIIWMLGDSVQS